MLALGYAANIRRKAAFSVDAAASSTKCGGGRYVRQVRRAGTDRGAVAGGGSLPGGRRRSPWGCLFGEVCL